MSCSGMMRRVSSLVRKKSTLTSTVVGGHSLSGKNEMLMVKDQEHGTGQASLGMTGKLLKVLPSKLESFVRQDTARTGVELWKVLNLNDISNMTSK